MDARRGEARHDAGPRGRTPAGDAGRHGRHGVGRMPRRSSGRQDAGPGTDASRFLAWMPGARTPTGTLSPRPPRSCTIDAAAECTVALVALHLEPEAFMLDRVETAWPGCVLVRADERWEADLSFWIDTHLRRDYFMPRRQLRELLARPNSDTWVIVIGGEVVGLAVVWGNLRLHNLLLDAAWRGRGLGGVVVEALGVGEVRAKTNMSTGDPRGFYEKLGFKETGIAGKTGTIRVMTRDDAGDVEQVEEISEEEYSALKKDAARWAAAKAAASARAKAAAVTRLKKQRAKSATSKNDDEAKLRGGLDTVKSKKTEGFVTQENPVAVLQH